MFPGMTYCILSRDSDFVADMITVLRGLNAIVHVATSFGEYRRIQDEGVVVEMLVVDPVFRIG
jgi:hypothetical protein